MLGLKRGEAGSLRICFVYIASDVGDVLGEDDGRLLDVVCVVGENCMFSCISVIW